MNSLLVVTDVMRIHRMPEADGNYRAVLAIDPKNLHAIERLASITTKYPIGPDNSSPLTK